MIYNGNVQDFGYYQVGNERHYSKILAIIAAEQNHEFPYFVFHDDVFGKFDWTKEPTKSLPQLYADRAWEIRNKYDYVVLHYSSGSDSQNILETFIENKIPLDEIIMRGSLKHVDRDFNNGSAKNMFAEVHFNAYPLAQHVKDTYYPHLKITVVDSTDYIMDYFKDNPNWFDLNNNPNSFLSPCMVARSDFDALNDDYKKITDSGKSIGHVLGIDKPMLNYIDGKFVIRFLDKFVNLFLPSRSTGLDLPLCREAFYWSPSSAQMIIKQAHVIKNYIKQNKLDPNILNQPRDRSTHDFVANLIYDRKFNVKFVTEKIKNIGIIFPYHEFFFKDATSDHVVNWRRGISEANAVIPDKWKHNGDIVNDLVGVWSRPYSIGS